ncbi:MAG: hypothetical protein OXG37_04920 [Actinomycetia bacterium]|nr:hypothetical protein [Actinomycetes bacterium]
MTGQGALITQAEMVVAALADGIGEAELDGLAGELASTRAEIREGTATLRRYVYPDGSRLRTRSSNSSGARPGVLVDAVSPKGRLTASRLVDLRQTGEVPRQTSP